MFLFSQHKLQKTNILGVTFVFKWRITANTPAAGSLSAPIGWSLVAGDVTSCRSPANEMYHLLERSCSFFPTTSHSLLLSEQVIPIAVIKRVRHPREVKLFCIFGCVQHWFDPLHLWHPTSHALSPRPPLNFVSGFTAAWTSRYLIFDFTINECSRWKDIQKPFVCSFTFLAKYSTVTLHPVQMITLQVITLPWKPSEQLVECLCREGCEKDSDELLDDTCLRHNIHPKVYSSRVGVNKWSQIP